MHDIYIAFTSFALCFTDTCTHSVPIFSITTERILYLRPTMRAFYVYAYYACFLYVLPTMQAFISTPHYAGYLYLRSTTRTFYVYVPLCGLFILMPHYAGFLYLRPTMRAFYIFAPLCGLLFGHSGAGHLATTECQPLPVPVKTSIGFHIS